MGLRPAREAARRQTEPRMDRRRPDRGPVRPRDGSLAAGDQRGAGAAMTDDATLDQGDWAGAAHRTAAKLDERPELRNERRPVTAPVSTSPKDVLIVARLKKGDQFR